MNLLIEVSLSMGIMLWAWLTVYSRTQADDYRCRNRPPSLRLLRLPLTAGQVGPMACHRPAALICRQHCAKAPPFACDGRPAQCGRAGSGGRCY
jgi:hypothetical protein